MVVETDSFEVDGLDSKCSITRRLAKADTTMLMFGPNKPELTVTNSLVMRSSFDARADLVLGCKLYRGLDIPGVTNGSDKNRNQALLASSIPWLIDVTRFISVLPCW